MAPKDPLEALESRRAELSGELSQLRDRLRDLGELRREQARVERELRAAEASLRTKRSLPLLDDVRIASPCSAKWDDMVGDDKVRFCRHCEKNVFNLSAMTRDEAEGLLAADAGEMCVRIYQRADGTVITSDCPIGARNKRVKRAALAAVGGTLLATAGAALAIPSAPCPTAKGPRSEMVDPKSAGAHETGSAPPVRMIMGRRVAPSLEKK